MTLFCESSNCKYRWRLCT